MTSRIIIILVFLGSTGTVKGQLTPIKFPPTKKQIKEDERNQNCAHVTKFDSVQLLKFFPFNKAKSVRLISFENPEPDKTIEYTSSEIKTETLKKSAPLDSLEYTNIKEKALLDKTELIALADLLYNHGYGGPVFTVSEYKCYLPRNAILFLDENDKTLAYIELCFECKGNRLSSDKVEAGEFCTQKYDLIKNFFAKQGIKYGISEGLIH